MAKLKNIKITINNKDIDLKFIFKDGFFRIELDFDMVNIPKKIETETYKEMMDELELIKEAIEVSENDSFIEEDVILHKNSTSISEKNHQNINKIYFINCKKIYSNSHDNKYIDNNDIYMIEESEYPYFKGRFPKQLEQGTFKIPCNLLSDFSEIPETQENKDNIEDFLNKVSSIFKDIDNLLSNIESSDFKKFKVPNNFKSIPKL